MNNLKSFESRKGHKVDVKEENGTIYMEVESVARGLGIVREKNGKSHPRYDRINANLKEFSSTLEMGTVPTKVGKGDFITESQFYLLALKATNEIAKAFQAWICVEVLPNIRQHGCYLSNEMTVEQIKAAQKYLNNTFIKKTMLTCSDEDLEKEYKLIATVNKDIDKTVIKQLQKREPSIKSNKLLLKLMNKEVNKVKKQNKKLVEKIDKLEPKDEEYTIIDAHGFSVNLQYTSDGAKIKRTDEYNKWLNNFPVEQIPNLEHIDFKKPVDVFLKFDHSARMDVTNMHKSVIDKICWELKVNDNKVQLQKCVTNSYVTDKKEGKIYICVKQG